MAECDTVFDAQRVPGVWDPAAAAELVDDCISALATFGGTSFEGVPAARFPFSRFSYRSVLLSLAAAWRMSQKVITDASRSSLDERVASNRAPARFQ